MQVPLFSLTQQITGLGDELDAAVLQVLHSGQYIGGSETRRFEEAFAALIGIPHVVSCNSGTDALVLALRGLGVGTGDEVITCSFNFFATAEAISAVGATPVFVDVDPTTKLINPNQIEAAITPATRVLLPVHLFGRPVAMDQLMAIAQRHSLWVIEDCAQAAGASWDNRPVGSWGDAGCFSFFPTKNLGGAGDGGAITCHDASLAQRMRELAVHGMPRRYLHTALGINSRLDALQAAVLNVKLPHLNTWLDQRRHIAQRYFNGLADIPGLTLPDPANDGRTGHSWNQFVLRIANCSAVKPAENNICTPSTDTMHSLSEGCCRDQLKQSLLDQGIQTTIYYPIPIHRQPAYSHLHLGPGSLPITEQLCSEVISLPIYPELPTDYQDWVMVALRQYLSRCWPDSQARIAA
ncbi:DegT/DnrJ/EryC1/StrS family aminotransferase [cyanobiont of Ornithocercus magnificus]|nr:DegT/DnrJ/EryC1/StrS family aminotransferase [cyanobiont of Ornithocercus magnificus]